MPSRCRPFLSATPPHWNATAVKTLPSSQCKRLSNAAGVLHLDNATAVQTPYCRGRRHLPDAETGEYVFSDNNALCSHFLVASIFLAESVGSSRNS